MKENDRTGKMLLSGKLDKYDAFTQMDFHDDHHSIWPQVTMLEKLTTQYPDARFILNTRDVKNHARSKIHWASGKFHRFITKHELKNLPSGVGSEEDIRNWISLHNQETRDFFLSRPHLKFLEVSIEDQNISQKLQKFLELKSRIPFPFLNKNMKLHR